MATMPLVAAEPWKWAEQDAKNENDLYKVFLAQSWQADQNDKNRAQQNNLQQNQFGQQSAENALNRQSLDSRLNMQLDYNRERDSLLMGGAAPQKLVEKMRSKMADLIGMGIPQHIAAAMVGNAVQESGIDATRIGDGGASTGEYQFNENGELPALRAYAQANGGDINDPKVQRAFVWSQLQGPYKSTLQKMMATKDPAVAAEIFSREYERPSAAYANNDKRRKYATQAFTLYGVRPTDANTQTADASTATPNPGVAQPPQQSSQQQSAPAPSANKSGAGTMPDPNKPQTAAAKPQVDGTIIEQRGDIIKYRKSDGSIGFKRVSNG